MAQQQLLQGLRWQVSLPFHIADPPGQRARRSDPTRTR